MPGKKKTSRKTKSQAKLTHSKSCRKTLRHDSKQQIPRINEQSTPNEKKGTTFTLRDEAFGVSKLSSKRLWQGSNGTKLRNLPVEFIRAVEDYDPGKFLRDQITLREQAVEDVELDNEIFTRTADIHTNKNHERDNLELLALAKAEARRIEGIAQPELTGDEDSSDHDSVNDFGASSPGASPGISAAVINMHIDDVSVITEPVLETEEMVESKHASAKELTPAEHICGQALETSNSQLDCSVDFNSLLNAIENSSSADESCTEPCLNQSEVEKDNDNVGLFPSSTEQVETSEAVLLPHEPGDPACFVVDTVGDASLVRRCHSSVDEDENFVYKPRSGRRQSSSSDVSLLDPVVTDSASHPNFTPWARVVDDSVQFTQTSSTTDFVMHPVPNSKDKGFRKRKTNRTRGGQVIRNKKAMNCMREEELIALDYMEHTQLDSSEEDELEGSEDSAGDAEPLINQLLNSGFAQLDDIEVEETNYLEGELATSESEAQFLSEDDTDIDDHLELMIEQEMDEMEFMGIGFPGPSTKKGRNNRGLGGHREKVDASLYHEDFNVYQYDSEDEEASIGELGASGAHKRGLGKFVEDLDLSDEELEAELIAQWKADKLSKRAKKRDRQRLHQDGIIGKKAKRAKAAHDIGNHDLDNFHNSIQSFLGTDMDELPLPTMDKQTRRAIHIIANAYNLKSRSQGSGKRRYPVLYKTKHSSFADPDFIESIMHRARRSVGVHPKFRDTLLPDRTKGRGPGMTGRPGRSGGGGKLRDGDVVGADAPEIHASNRGRAMLEKLGWISGGLGAVNNKGIETPIFATIKNSKAGL